MLLRDAGSGSDESASSSLPPASHRSRRFRTAPLMTPKMPPGVPNVIVNEAAERFSFYGMKGILVVFMTHHLRDAAGRPDVLSEAAAREYYHAFTSAVYLTPIGGALLAEGVIGKYRTIVYLSVVYCGGHLVLALNETRAGLVGGLFLIALGSGGIKPCVSAVLGDQFGEMNQHLMSSTFAYFYLAINFGAFTSTLLTPYLLEHVGSHAAFGVPGVAMAVATLVFWSGRYKYAHVPADRRFCRETCSKEGAVLLGRLLGLFVFFAAFWSLYDQSGSAWVLQAEKMDRHFGGVEWLPSQIAAINPLLILTLVPLFHGFELGVPRARLLPARLLGRCGLAPGRQAHIAGVYERIERCGVRVTPLRKMSVGFFVCAAAFLIPLQVEAWIEAGGAALDGPRNEFLNGSGADGGDGSAGGGNSSSARPLACARGDACPSIAWHLLAYLVMTTSEILVSITGLEFSYTQAPPSMKSMIMACYLGATSAGNMLTVLINVSIQNPDGSTKWTDVEYFRFFTMLMFATALAFVPYAYFFKEKRFVQGAAEQQRQHQRWPRELAAGDVDLVSTASAVDR